MTLYSIPLNTEDEYLFTAEESLSVVEKRQILQDWQRFMLSGFKRLFFTPPLYRFLSHSCAFSAKTNLYLFWTYYFDCEVVRLRALLGQFAGNKRSAEYATCAWLDGPAADLKAAMCCETERLYAPLLQVLQDLEYKYEELIVAWHDFAAAANITDTTLPPAYQVSENTRNLLAYAAQIAFTLSSQRPLTCLQMMFPLQPQPLLQPVPVEGSEIVVLNNEGGVQ